jgi:hypothetical protein
MPKRSSKPRPEEPDTNLTAFRVVQEATRAPRPPKPEKNPAAVTLGRLGGQKGGKARAAKLSPERRKEIARKAASSRWAKTPPRDP